jgi:hypothetical protein
MGLGLMPRGVRVLSDNANHFLTGALVALAQGTSLPGIGAQLARPSVVPCLSINKMAFECVVYIGMD